MPKKLSSPNLAFVLVVLIGILLPGIALLAAIFGIQTDVENSFGAPSPRLTSTQRILLTWQLWQEGKTLTNVSDPSGSEQVFQIAIGEAVDKISGHLQQQGLITNADAFRSYLVYSGLDISIQAGEYQLSPAMTAIQIAHTLQDSTPTTVTFTVLPGWRTEEIAASLPTSGLNISPEEFLAIAAQTPEGYTFSVGLPASASSEGYLFPGSHELSRQTEISELMKILLSASERNLNGELRQGFAAQGLSLHEGVILASIIQREGIRDGEMPMIASVFYNRLAEGMSLKTDPTIQYAVGYNTEQNTWWTNPISLEDLQIASPYNTYLYPGLPPGPICNPGLAALQAAAHPSQTPYYYFRAACNGSGLHNFSVTFDEHQANACP